jgi:chemotaxis protein methyltransferase CheR
MDHDLEILQEYLADNFGFHYYKTQDVEFAKKIEKSARAFNVSDTSSFVKRVYSNKLSKSELEKFISMLTIGETYFFRDKELFEYLELIHLPKLIRERENTTKTLRIWSAGCASGEEPYTIAIILRRLIRDIANWNITILATDVNTTFLDKARKGVYSDWSFRKTPDFLQKKYFTTPFVGKYKIRNEIKDMVTFTYHNLVVDSYPSMVNNTNAMDMVFCRNVFIYFRESVRNAITKRLYHTIIKDGLLLVSPVEVSILLDSDFNKLIFDSNKTIFIKSDKQVNNKPVKRSSVSRKIATRKDSSKTDFKTEIVKSLSDRRKVKPKQRNDVSVSKQQEEKLMAIDSEIEFKRANELFIDGNYGEAKVIFKGLIENNSGFINDSYKYLIRCEANLGNLEQAKIYCEEAIDLNKLDDEIYYLLAIVQQELKYVQESIANLKKVVFLNPENVLAHFTLGNIYQKQGDIKAVIRSYNNVIKILAKYDSHKQVDNSDGITASELKIVTQNKLKLIDQSN